MDICIYIVYIHIHGCFFLGHLRTFPFTNPGPLLKIARGEIADIPPWWHPGRGNSHLIPVEVLGSVETT